MKLIIDIPEKEFGVDINDKFQDFFSRLKAEIKNHLITDTSLVCGAYELETIDMFLKAFNNGTPLRDAHRIRCENCKYYDASQIECINDDFCENYDGYDFADDAESEDKLDGDPIDIDKAVKHYEGTLEVLKGIDLEVDA